MVITSYMVAVGDTLDVDKKSNILSALDRDKYMTGEYLRLAKEYLSGLDLKGKSAFLFAGGPVVHHSEGRNVKNLLPYGEIAIKSQAGYSTYRIIRSIKADFSYASINGNTCASSMFSLYEAYNLLHKEGYDNVVIFAGDMVEESQLEVFKQLNIDITCGDGMAIAVLSKEGDGIASIDNVAWTWHMDPSPMTVTPEGYGNLLKKLDTTNINVVKPHGTGTDRNDTAEDIAIAQAGLDHIPTRRFKQDIGHTQGASALLELLLSLEELDKGKKVLCLASGLGGFYGGCTATRR